MVLELRNDQISRITRFGGTGRLAAFGLPPELDNL
jgi:hypothetical protein